MSALQARLYKHNKKIEKKLKGWIFEHLQRLSPDDRRMRFFITLSDDAIKNYLDKIRECDEIFLTMDSIGGKIKVTGFLHIASLEDDAYEIGISVDEDQRKNGIASQLFDRAFMFLKARGCKKLYINCLSTNTAMQKIVRRYKMEVRRDVDDPTTSTAFIEMNPIGDFYSWLQGNNQDNIALFNLAVQQLLPGKKNGTT